MLGSDATRQRELMSTTGTRGSVKFCARSRLLANVTGALLFRASQGCRRLALAGLCFCAIALIRSEHDVTTVSARDVIVVVARCRHDEEVGLRDAEAGDERAASRGAVPDLCHLQQVLALLAVECDQALSLTSPPYDDLRLRQLLEIESIVSRYWYTDDTAMALGILEVLRDEGAIDRPPDLRNAGFANAPSAPVGKDRQVTHIKGSR